MRVSSERSSREKSKRRDEKSADGFERKEIRVSEEESAFRARGIFKREILHDLKRERLTKDRLTENEKGFAFCDETAGSAFARISRKRRVLKFRERKGTIRDA